MLEAVVICQLARALWLVRLALELDMEDLGLILKDEVTN